MPCAACALPDTRPRYICSQLNAAANNRHSASAPIAPAMPPLDPEPDDHADDDRDERAPHDQRRVGHRPAEEQRPTRHGQRSEPVEQAAIGVLGHADGAAGEQSVHRGERGDEEVDVLDVAGLDGAAEHEAEDQQEHDRRQRVDDEQLRCADELLDRAAGVGAGGGPHGRRVGGRGEGEGHAGAPVSARKTSSRVGRRRPMSSSSMPLSLRPRTASARRLVPVGDGHRHAAARFVEPWLLGAQRGEHRGHGRRGRRRGRRAPRSCRGRPSPSARSACQWRSTCRGR